MGQRTGPDPSPGPGETLDRLAGDWWVFQLRCGHRYATDDVLVAWTAWRARPDALRILDLGAGVGSVGLMTLLRLPVESHLTTLEVQAVSIALQRKTVVYNGVGDRVEIRHGDLRAAGLLGAEERFDLIVANPPYLPPGSAVESYHPQRAAARMEHHGDIFDFCRSAGMHLDGRGRFCFSFPAGERRAELAVAESGMQVFSRQEVIFREGGKAVIALFTCGYEGDRVDRPPLTTRLADGRRTEAYRRVRIDMQMEEP